MLGGPPSLLSSTILQPPPDLPSFHILSHDPPVWLQPAPCPPFISSFQTSSVSSSAVRPLHLRRASFFGAHSWGAHLAEARQDQAEKETPGPGPSPGAQFGWDGGRLQRLGVKMAFNVAALTESYTFFYKNDCTCTLNKAFIYGLIKISHHFITRGAFLARQHHWKSQNNQAVVLESTLGSGEF